MNHDKKEEAEFDMGPGANGSLGSLTLVALCLAIAGCGGGNPDIVPVSGTVVMNGKPLTGYIGFVRVVPADGRPATARIDPADGSFTLTTEKSGDGCLLGNHPAAVIVNTMVGSRLLWLIPEKYGNHKTSGLTANIDGPTDSLTIELSGELKRNPNKPIEDFDPNADTDI